MKLRLRLLPIAILLIALALVVGCSEDSNVAADPNTDPDVNATDADYQIAAENLAYALTDENDGMLVLWQPVPPMQCEGPQGEPMADHFRDFSNLHDTTFTHNDFTTTIDVTFFDADDNPSETYDPETSVRLERTLTMTGEHSDDHRQVEIDMLSDLSMDNILATDTIRVINEDATRSEIGEMQGRHEDHVRTWDATNDWQTTDLNVHTDYDNYPYPLSGTVYHHTYIEKTLTTGHSTRTVTIEIGSTITFDGTNMALVVMDDGSTFYIDLDTGENFRRPRP